MRWIVAALLLLALPVAADSPVDLGSPIILVDGINVSVSGALSESTFNPTNYPATATVCTLLGYNATDKQAFTLANAVCIDVDGLVTFTSVLDEAEGDEVALTLNYTTDKLTSGADTGLVIDQTDTDSPGVSLLLDLKVGGTSKFKVDNDGQITSTQTNGVFNVSANGIISLGKTGRLTFTANADPTIISLAAAGHSLQFQTSLGGFSFTDGTTSFLELGLDSNHTVNSLLDAATGDEVALTLNYTTNKATSGADTGLVIDQTDTDSPGVSLLLDLKVGGSSLFSVDNVGNAQMLTGGAGIARTDGTFHVHTASAGSVAAQGNGDDLVIEGSGNTGMTILTPDANVASIYLGSEADSIGAVVNWHHDNDLMTVGTGKTGASLKLQTGNAVEAVFINPDQDAAFAGAISGANQAATLGSGITTVAVTTNFLTLTGDGSGNTVATITGGAVGQVLRILFVDALVTITDTDAHTSNTVDLSASFTGADDVILTLLYDGTSWYETARSVN